MNNPLGLRLLTTTLAGVMTISMVACNQPADTAGSPAPSITVGIEIDDRIHHPNQVGTARRCGHQEL